MSTDTNQTASSRSIHAFFDTAGAARKAVDDLIAAGIPRQHITETGGRDAEAGTSTHGEHTGFWAELKALFLPDDDRDSYAEGLRRGGFLVAVEADEANYNRVIGIMDTDGAVNLDERESQWRTEGWAPRRADSMPPLAGDVPAAGLMAGSTLSAGVGAPAVPTGDNARAGSVAYGTDRATSRTGADQAWRSDDVARAAALDGSVAATAAAARVAVRDDSHGRPNLRGYRMADVGDGLTERAGGEAPAGSFVASRDAGRIVEHMDVISADGQRIGTVDHLDGPDRIKLTKTASPDGRHHLVPFTWIDHVDQHVHLSKTLAEIKAQATS